MSDTPILPNVPGVIFDMDGVLCDSEPFMIQAAQKLYVERFGREIDEAAFEPFYGRGDVEFICGPPEGVGITVDRDALMAAFFESYFALIDSVMQPLPGVVPLITKLHEAGMKLAVATSSDPRKLAGNLRVIRIPPEMFATLVSAQDVDRKKPAPDLFLAAAKRLALPPGDCIVVEDTPSGVKAAKSAGCFCVAVQTNFDEPTLRTAGADIILPDLTHWP